MCKQTGGIQTTFYSVLVTLRDFDDKKWQISRVCSDLELVANADEAQFASLLFGVLGGVWVLKQLSDKFVFGLAH